MRLLFVLVGVALCLGTAAFLARPLWWSLLRSRRSTLSDDVRALSVQLRQLAELHRSGTLNEEQYGQGKALVERKLLDALSPVSDAADPIQAGPRPSIHLIAALCIFLFGVAGGGYLWVGSPESLGTGPGDAVGREPTVSADVAGADGAASAPHALSQEKVTAMVEELVQRLKAKPDDGEGWQMLARSYVVIGRHAEAVDAFKQADRLHPNDPILLADYADALAMANGRSLDGEPAALVDRALKIDPKNPKALALAGTVAFDHKNYKRAVELWERLLQADSADGQYAQQIQGGIAEARQLAGMPPAAVVNDATRSSATGGGQVSGTVLLAPGMKGRVAPDDTVFVFARAADGPPMPLAILRKQVKDLPLRFTLDDSLAMSSDAKMSGATKVNVGARVSKSGNATPQKGDLQGTASGVTVGSSDVALEINQEVTK